MSKETIKEYWKYTISQNVEKMKAFLIKMQ